MNAEIIELSTSTKKGNLIVTVEIYLTEKEYEKMLKQKSKYQKMKQKALECLLERCVE